MDLGGNTQRVVIVKVNNLVLGLSTKMPESKGEVRHWNVRLVDSYRLSTSTDGIERDEDIKEWYDSWNLSNTNEYMVGNILRKLYVSFRKTPHDNAQYIFVETSRDAQALEGTISLCTRRRNSAQ